MRFDRMARPITSRWRRWVCWTVGPQLTLPLDGWGPNTCRTDCPGTERMASGSTTLQQAFGQSLWLMFGSSE